MAALSPSGTPIAPVTVAPPSALQRPLPHTYTGGRVMDFDDVWTDYQTWLLVAAMCAHGTVIEYGATLRRWNRWLRRRGIRWDAAGPDELKAFLARPAGAGPRKGQPISVARRRADTIAIHGLYRWAVAAGLLERDPFALVRLPKRRQGTPRSFTLAQLAAILRGAREDPRLHLLCLLGYPQGLRRAEMAALDLADLVREPYPGVLRVVGKGGRERWVPLHRLTRRAIDRHLGDRAQLTTGPLVANYSHPGKPLEPGTVGDLLAAHVRACGIPYGSAHWFRHSTATWALEAAEGTNLEDVRELLGHRDSATTRVYGARFKWNVRRNVIEVIPDPTEGTP